ncbi:MAG: ABC transporter permease [Halobacteriaceae archaeon]
MLELHDWYAGTLERILVAPVTRSGIVIGYVLGYGVLATIQSLVLLGAAIEFRNVEFAYDIGLFFLVELLGALTALGIGIVLSLFAENEFQAIQFIPMVIMPQAIIGGTFLPIDQLPTYLE